MSACPRSCHDGDHHLTDMLRCLLRLDWLWRWTRSEYYSEYPDREHPRAFPEVAVNDGDAVESWCGENIFARDRP